jgi:four helix bundle protein
MAQRCEDMIVWQRAIDLTECIYRLTRSFPKDEQYGLVSQMRRASVSVASNISEGRGRPSPLEFRRFLGLSLGSLFELKTQIVIAKRLGFGQNEALNGAASLAEEVSKMLTAFIRTLSSRTRKTES